MDNLDRIIKIILLNRGNKDINVYSNDANYGTYIDILNSSVMINISIFFFSKPNHGIYYRKDVITYIEEDG